MTPEQAVQLLESGGTPWIAIPAERKLSKYKDLNAFLLLEKLSKAPTIGTSRMVSCAEHDEIGLGAMLTDICEAATVQDILDLSSCGVMVDEEGYLKMFT